jgi:hypothetical protein
MNLHQLIFTANDCYKSGKAITPKGIMVHSTGANNPNLKRYVGPDDGLLGVNAAANHWNTAKPGGSAVCVHAFIGKMADGSIAMTLQGAPNRVYSILSSTNLANPLASWPEVRRLTNTGGQTVFTNPVPSAASQRFYRAKEL